MPHAHKVFLWAHLNFNIAFNGDQVHKEQWLFLEWILQNKVEHRMIFTQHSIVNPQSPDVDENRSYLLGRELRE